MNEPGAERAYLFSHAMLREVAYGLQLPSERAHLHEQALAVLEAAFAQAPQLVASELARHAHAAALEAAGDDARRLKLAEARFLELAIMRALHRDEPGVTLELCHWQLENEHATPAQRLAALRVRCDVAASVGNADKVLEYARALAVQARAAGNEDLAAEALSHVVNAHVARGNLDLATQETSAAAAQEGADANPTMRARVASARASIAYAGGRADEAEPLFARAAQAWHEAGNQSMALSAKGNLANVLGATGRREEAEAMLAALADELARLGFDRMECVAHINLAKQWLARGRVREAGELFRRTLAPLRATGQLRSESFALGNLAEVAIKSGRFDEAQSCLARALELTAELGLPSYHAAYLCTRAGLDLLLGHEREAQEAIAQARSEFEQAHGAAFIAEYCDIWRLRIAAAQACTEPAGRGTARLDAQPPQARWVRVAEAVLLGMKQSLQGRRNAATTDLAKRIAEGEAVMAELQTALREQRPALLFYGYTVGELLPELRRALVQRLQKKPARWKALQATHPALAAAMTA